MSLIASLRASLQQPLRSSGQQLAFYATKAAEPVNFGVTVQKEWKDIKVPEKTLKDIPTTIPGGAAFPNDLRSISGLGLGDGIKNHTDKWMRRGTQQKSPMEYIMEAEPILVEGPVVASMGSEDPATGCPVEYINLKGTSKEQPAVCKYTGNKYYSLPHTWFHH